MSLIFFKHAKSNQNVVTSDESPLPVQVIERGIQPPIAGRTVLRRVKVPGIGTGAEYADGDTFGTLITLRDVFRPEKRSGVVTGILFYDLDDEGLAMDVAFFAHPIAQTADNSAFAPTDEGLLACQGVVNIATTSFVNWSANQIGVVKDVGLWVQSDDTNLYVQMVARGTVNITAAMEPYLAIVVVPD